MNADGSSRRVDDILFYIPEPSEPSKVASQQRVY